MNDIGLRLGIQQRVLPTYRAPLFDTLGEAALLGLSVFAGLPRPEEAIETAVVLHRAALYRAKNVHIGRGRSYLCYQRGLVSWLEAWRPQALIVEANPRYPSTPRGLRWMRAHRSPVIGWGLGAPESSGRLAGLRRLVRQAFLRQFDALITYSSQGAREYIALGFPEERVFVAPNAVAPRPTHPLPERTLLALPHQLTVLFVGRLQARKRIDVLIQACAALPEELRPHLWVVGDGPERAALEALAKATYPRARFLGARFGPELERVFLAADLFVLPGTGGLALQQAMAYGLPVLAAEADGTQTDLVRPGNGWRLPPGDQAALVHCLRAALSDAPRLRAMGAESYRIASQEIHLEGMISAFAGAVQAAADYAGKRAR